MPDYRAIQKENSQPQALGSHVHRWLGICLDGYPFLALAVLLTVAGFHWGGAYWGCPLFILAIWVAWFFRDPERVVPAGTKTIVSPADGKVIDIREVDYPRLVEGKAIRISIFMSVFNVHVNRLPVGGMVRGLHYNPGKYFAAYAEKASLLNEQSATWIQTREGKNVVLVQIAGLVARRIVNRLSLEESVEKGNRFGLIRFGSRCDLYLPVGTKIDTELGAHVQAGATVLGEFS